MERMQEMKQNHYGTYNEVTDEKEVVRITACVFLTRNLSLNPGLISEWVPLLRHEPRCVVHFYHPNFKRCEIMDKHLAVCLSWCFSHHTWLFALENRSQIFQHEVLPRLRWKYPVACRETRHKGPTLCDMLCERCHKRSVGIFDYVYWSFSLSWSQAWWGSRNLGTTMRSQRQHSNWGYLFVVRSSPGVYIVEFGTKAVIRCDP